MSSKISEHGSSQDELLDNSMFDSFNLFLSLMTPVEFARLLRSRVNHLLQTWPSPPTSDSPQGQSDTLSSLNLPYISMDSVLAFTSFFRIQEMPATSESGAKLTPSSPDHIRQHLKALETLLSCLHPNELQELIKSRLKEGGKERTDAIRGLMDVMRRAASMDETPKNNTMEEKSSLHLNLGSNVEQSETPFTNTYTINLSPGTAPIPRVMSPGTRDQSADDDSNVQPDDSKKLSSQSGRNHEPRTRQNASLMSPTLPTSKVSTSSITSPTRSTRHNVKLKLESSNKGKESVLKSPGSRHADSTLGQKSLASPPYAKVPQSTRRTRSSAALVPEPSPSRNPTKARISEKPRRKSERLSKRNQHVTKSKGSKQSSKKEPTMSPSPPSDKPIPPTSPATSSSHNELSPVGPSDQAASSFFSSSADGRTSPPGPVLRAVDWSTPVRSTPISSEEDHEMEDEEEELDELADDSSEGLVSEIINGWNSHMVDAEPEIGPSPPSQVEPPTSTDRTPPIPDTPIILKEEIVSTGVVLTLLPEPSSPIPPLVSLRSSPSGTEPIVSADKQSVVDKSSNITSIAIPEDHSMDVDFSSQVPPETPPPAPSTPIQAQTIPPPAYPSFYSNPHPPLGRNSYPQVGPPTVEASQPPPHPSQPPPHHHSPHLSNVSTHPSYQPSSQSLPAHHHANPYPPPPPPNHPYTHDYHAPPPPPPPSHIPPYPPQHPPYTPSSSWYGNPYYPPQPPPSYPQYPQQLNLSLPPNRDQHHHAPHLRPPHPPHSQSYPPPHYSQQPPPVPPPQFPPIRAPQNQYPSSQDNNSSQFPPPQPSVNHYHHPPPPSFPPSGPSTAYPHPSSSMQQQGLIHSHYPPSQSTSVHLPHHFPSPHSHLAQPPAHSLHDNTPTDTVGSRSGLYSINNSAPITVSAPRPPSPIIPPPLGPRPPQPLNPLPSPQRRSPSPPVKPPEGPKRFFQKRRTDEEGGDVNFPGVGSGAGDQDDPNVRYTSEVGIKETLSIRRRCHNCRTVEAPSWRKSKLSIGKILCNKCGIYESTHLMARPLKTRPRRLMLSGEQRDPYQFEIYTASPVTPFGSPTFRRKRSTSDNDDDFDFDE